MIKILAVVAMDYGVLPSMEVLDTWPKGATLVMGVKMAQRIGKPLEGQRCLVLSSLPVEGWETISKIPTDCIVVGGHGVFRQAIHLASKVILVVEPVATGGKKLDLCGFEEVSRHTVDGKTILELV